MSFNPPYDKVQGYDADGAATTVNPVQVGGKDGSGNVQSILTGSDGSVKVDGSGATQPVSGTVSAAQSGTWTVQPGNTANTTAWKVDGSAVTQPVSGTVTANLGTISTAATSAKQDTGNTSLSSIDGKLTTAKTADFDSGAGTDTVQMTGIALPASGGAVAGGTSTNPIQVSVANTGANATAVKVDGSAATQPVSGTVSSAQSGTWTVQPGNTANTTAWKVDGSAVTQPVSGTVSITANSAVNVAQVNGVTTQTGTGTAGTGTQRVAVASDSSVVLATGSAQIGHLEANQSTNVAQINGVTVLMGAGNTGTGSQRVTIASDQAVIPISDNSGSLTVDAPVGTPVFSTITPSTSGGWSTFMASSADGSTALTNSAQVIKGSAGTFGGYYIYNPNTSATYVHIYNVAAASVTVGTTNPTNTFCIPASSGANLEITNGIQYGTAMSCSATTTGGGNSAPSTALEANFWYK